jgi:hypothetical protein
MERSPGEKPSRDEKTKKSTSPWVLTIEQVEQKAEMDFFK